MKTATILGYPVHLGSADDLKQALLSRMAQGETLHVVTLNPEMLMQGRADTQLGQALKSADLILPDGAGVVWALKRQGVHNPRVPGIEFSESLIAQAARDGDPIALVGAAPEVLAAAQQQLCKRYPGLQIAYAHHGFFTSDAHRREVAEACAVARPRYVFVALGVPRQEFWIREFRPLFQTPAALVGVGGSFDVWSGLKKRAHPLFLKLNLEWLWRISSEPWRLKRVAKTLPMFVVNVLLNRQEPVQHH